MKIFCDTSVLVAASLRNHEHFPRAIEVIKRVKQGTDKGYIACHSLLEIYAVLTRIPVSPVIHPADVNRIVQENILAHFETISLGSEDYVKTIKRATEAGVIGGGIYDFLILQCAQLVDCHRIYTFNLNEFRRLIPSLANKIVAP